jgi:hypothetical protein
MQPQSSTGQVNFHVHGTTKIVMRVVLCLNSLRVTGVHWIHGMHYHLLSPESHSGEPHDLQTRILLQALPRVGRLATVCKYVPICSYCPSRVFQVYRRFPRVFLKEGTTPGDQVLNVGRSVSVFFYLMVSSYMIDFVLRFTFQDFCRWSRLVMARPSVLLLL